MSFAHLKPLALGALVASLVGCNSDTANLSAPQNNTQDRTFLSGATQASNGEISAAQLALTKSTNPDVLAFANKMISDHTAEKQASAPIAATINEPLPTTIPPKQVPIAAQLAALTGAAFDKLYINSEIAGHEDNINLNYDPEISGGENPAVVSYAKTYLPQVQMHLTMAQADKTKYGF